MPTITQTTTTRPRLAGELARRAFVPLATALTLLAASSIAHADPQYTIVNLGVAIPGDSAARGQGISTNGIAAGYSLGTNASGQILTEHAFSWTQSGGNVGFTTNPPGHSFGLGESANNNGLVAGYAAVNSRLSAPIPTFWQNGTYMTPALPAGTSTGAAYSVNDSGIASGYALDSFGDEYATLFTTTTSAVLTQTVPDGGLLQTAYGINNAGQVVGVATNPNNAAVTEPFLLNGAGAASAINLGALPGDNGGIAFAINQLGDVVGVSSYEGAGSDAFLWTASGGMQALPSLNAGDEASARGINDSDVVVGSDFTTGQAMLWESGQPYYLGDLIPANSGWSMQSSYSAAFGISDSGIIVGQALYNGQIQGFAMIPDVPEPASIASVGVAISAGLLRRRRV